MLLASSHFTMTMTDVLYFYLAFQTPTSKQSKYKEQVAEIRKGRNSGLPKEQKEKHMVHHRHSLQLLTLHNVLLLSVLHCILLLVCSLTSVPPPDWSTGASADTRQHQGTSAGEHHQWIWSGTFQESSGPCIWRPGNEQFHVSISVTPATRFPKLK